MNVAQLLDNLRADTNKSDFAKQLAIPRRTMTAAYNGQIKHPIKLMASLLVHYPNRSEEIVAVFLRSNGHIIA